LAGSNVYGASVWDIKVNDRTKQHNLAITPFGRKAAVITVDNIKVAQFIYLLLNNQAIRKVIDTITSKAVLILGRFTEERKLLLDTIRDELRKHNYLPIQFDFQPSANRTRREKVRILADMARFVIADLTDPRSVLQELEIHRLALPNGCRTFDKKLGEPDHGMLDFKNSRWFVAGTYEYENEEEVIASIKENVIGPAEEKVEELRRAIARGLDQQTG
jgi:hypothetical protein